MSETISIYAGSNRAGMLRKRALEKEAKRQGRHVSISDVIWDMVREHGSEKLLRDLEIADKIEK